ncbi:MAG: glycosyltransferase [Coriobacteriia bacterium]
MRVASRVQSGKRLSIITSAYRSGAHIRACCDNILALENIDEIESVLVLNDPDEVERAVVDEYASAHPEVFTVVVTPARETIGESINRGMRVASGECLGFLDVDDIRAPDSYARQIATLDENPAADFTYGDIVIVPSQGCFEGQLVEAPEFDRYEFTRSCLASPTQLFRRSLVDRIGGFDEQFRSGGDYEFQIRAALNCTFVRTPGVLVYYTRAPGSASGSRLQPLERTAIELRYALYDKTMELEGYQFVEEARTYRLGNILVLGVWKDIREVVPGYDELLDAGAEGRLLLDSSLARWRRWEIVRGPAGRLRGAARSVKRSLVETLRGART